MPEDLNLLRLVRLTGAMASPAEAHVGYRTDLDQVRVYDGVQERVLNAVGWCTHAYPETYNPQMTSATSVSLAAVSGGNGGSIDVPIMVPAMLRLDATLPYTVYCSDASGLHTAEARLYVDRLNNSSTVDEIAGTNASWSFTPGAAGVFDSGALPGNSIDVPPGILHFVMRNTSASVIFALGAVNPPSMARAHIATKNNAALGSTLDLTTSWSRVNQMVFVRLNGRVMGQAAKF